MISFLIPIRLGRGLNDHEHWTVRAKRVKRERNAVRLLWPRRATIALPVVVLLTRISPGTRLMDAEDNLTGSLKAVRDQVAAQLGIDDGDRSAASWEYAQERGAWGVRVEIRARADVGRVG